MNVPMPTDAQVSPPVSTRLVHSYATVVQELLTILRVNPVKVRSIFPKKKMHVGDKMSDMKGPFARANPCWRRATARNVSF